MTKPLKGERGNLEKKNLKKIWPLLARGGGVCKAFLSGRATKKKSFFAASFTIQYKYHASKKLTEKFQCVFLLNIFTYIYKGCGFGSSVFSLDPDPVYQLCRIKHGTI